MTQAIDALSELQRVTRVAELLNDNKSREELNSYRLALEAASASRLASWQISRLPAGDAS